MLISIIISSNLGHDLTFSSRNYFLVYNNFQLFDQTQTTIPLRELSSKTNKYTFMHVFIRNKGNFTTEKPFNIFPVRFSTGYYFSVPSVFSENCPLTTNVSEMSNHACIFYVQQCRFEIITYITAYFSPLYWIVELSISNIEFCYLSASWTLNSEGRAHVLTYTNRDRLAVA